MAVLLLFIISVVMYLCVCILFVIILHLHGMEIRLVAPPDSHMPSLRSITN